MSGRVTRWSVVLGVTLVALPIGAQVRMAQPVAPLVTPTTQGTSGPPSGGRSYVTINWGDAPATTLEVASFSFGASHAAAMGNRMAAQPQGGQELVVTVLENAAFARLQQAEIMGRPMELTLVINNASGQMERQCVMHHAMVAQWSTSMNAGDGRPMGRATFAGTALTCTTSASAGNPPANPFVAAPAPGNAVYGMPAPKQPN